MNLKEIGKKVKELRVQEKMSQSELAELIDISTVHMSHIETGSVCMSLPCLLSLCNALNTTPNNILLGEYTLSKESTTSMLSESIEALTNDERLLLIGFANLLSNHSEKKNN